MSDPIPTFSHLISSLASSHPSLAYLSLVEPRVEGDSDNKRTDISGESNEFAYKIWQPKALLTAGWTSDPERAAKEADDKGILAGFGRAFIANVSSGLSQEFGIWEFETDC